MSAQIILFLGRLNTDKGLRELSASMLSLKDRYPNLHWLIVGPDEGGMVDFLREKGVLLGNRLHFQKFTDEPEAYMAASDIFCLPSYREGFGTAVLEAAAVGLPTVATKIYGLIDAVEDGVTGILVPPKNNDDLTSALDTLLSQPLLLKKMGAAARNRAILRFSRQRIVEGLHNFYSGLLFSLESHK
jgi:glycosyltransferase involved in cell wall biosynthesis